MSAKLWRRWGWAYDLLTKEQLGAATKKGEIDTVVVAFTDMQGRLMGKRVDAEYFMESAAHGEPVEGCNYLLAVDMDMDPVPGYAIANWESGYGDFDMVPKIKKKRPDTIVGGAGGLALLARLS